MEDGLERVRAILGDETQSGLSDGVIRDALWETYFDVEQAVDWLVRAYHHPTQNISLRYSSWIRGTGEAEGCARAQR